MADSESRKDNGSKNLDELVDGIFESYQSDQRTQHLDSIFLPSRAKAIQVVELLRRVIFPGFFDDQRLSSQTVKLHIGDLLGQLHELLYEQIRQSLRYEQNRIGEVRQGDECPECDLQAQNKAVAFLGRLVEVRRLLSLDVQASFDGDPAAANTDETIFCYPGIDAIFIYRAAHELYELGVPMLPRIMTEYAHNETGVDIHPGAQIGESFFIDHGTGVVIGQTCRIGNRVKIYQGVTLGALSTKGGQAWREKIRHPQIEDDVTIYGGAIILGGETVIGKGSVIGGSVFITESVPPHHVVTMKFGELKLTARPLKGQKTLYEDG